LAEYQYREKQSSCLRNKKIIDFYTLNSVLDSVCAKTVEVLREGDVLRVRRRWKEEVAVK